MTATIKAGDLYEDNDLRRPGIVEGMKRHFVLLAVHQDYVSACTLDASSFPMGPKSRISIARLCSKRYTRIGPAKQVAVSFDTELNGAFGKTASIIAYTSP